MLRGGPAGKPQVKVKRILVPTDFSPGAEPALHWASALAGVFGAEMLLLHVLDVRLAAIAGLPPQMASMPAVDELVQSASAEAAQQLRALGERFPDARTIFKEGVPRVIILEVAKAEDADLIIMGTHGRTGLSHAFFGSVAEHVVRHSDIPVLTARQEDLT
ncbi:MAG: universal stress protein [bacterium]